MAEAESADNEFFKDGGSLAGWGRVKVGMPTPSSLSCAYVTLVHIDCKTEFSDDQWQTV